MTTRSNIPYCIRLAMLIFLPDPDRPASAECLRSLRFQRRHATRCGHLPGLVQIEIKLQNIYYWLTEKPELPPLRMRGDNLTHHGFVQTALARNPRHLKLSGCRRDVGIKPGTR